MLTMEPDFQISRYQSAAQFAPDRSRSTVEGTSSGPIDFPDKRRVTSGRRCLGIRTRLASMASASASTVPSRESTFPASTLLTCGTLMAVKLARLCSVFPNWCRRCCNCSKTAILFFHVIYAVDVTSKHKLPCQRLILKHNYILLFIFKDKFLPGRGKLYLLCCWTSAPGNRNNDCLGFSYQAKFGTSGTVDTRIETSRGPSQSR